jgi:hypothetical protein
VHKLSKNKFSNVYELTEDESRHAGRLDKSHYWLHARVHLLLLFFRFGDWLICCPFPRLRNWLLIIQVIRDVRSQVFGVDFNVGGIRVFAVQRIQDLVLSSLYTRYCCF